jgi:hypothetical protein
VTTKQVRETLTADSIGKNKAGNFVARWGFFYTMGRTEEKYAAEVRAACPQANIVSTGCNWASFRGGQSISAGSHFWVEFNFNQEAR